MEVGVPIGEEPDLQRLDQAFDVLGAGEHRRHHDQRARTARGSPLEKSMRGSGRGVTSSVASQFTIPTASWLARQQQDDPEQWRQQSAGDAIAMRLRQQRRGESDCDRRDRAEVEQQGDAPPDCAERLGRANSASPPRARGAADPCRSGRSRRGRRDRRRRFSRRCRRRLRGRAGSPCAPPRFRPGGCPSRSPRRRAGSGRAWRNPSGRRARPDPRAASARRRSSSRRTRASPSRRGSAGCRWCC